MARRRTRSGGEVDRLVLPSTANRSDASAVIVVVLIALAIAAIGLDAYAFTTL